MRRSPSLGRNLVLLLSCLLLGGGCSTVHMDNPRHSWLPLTHRVYDGKDCCNDNCEMHPGIPRCMTGRQQFSAMQTELLLPFAFFADVLSIPFHSLGHLFAKPEPPIIPKAAAPTPQP